MPSVKLFPTLRALGLDPDMKTLDSRKKSQKGVYLAQEVAGINTDFHFDWYIHGPYSPQLTKILYDKVERGQVEREIPLNSDENKRLNELKNFLGDDIESADTLELLVSLHYLRKLGRRYGASKLEVINTLKSKKPWYSKEEIENYWNKLERLEQYED